MNDEHRNALQANLHHICRELDAEDVLPYLCAKGIVQEEKAEEILKITRKSTRNMQLVTIIKAAGPLAFQEFINALHFCDKKYLVEIILAHPPTTISQLTSTDLIAKNNTVQATSSAVIPAVISNSGALLHDIYGGTIHINIAHGNMNSGGTNEQHQAPSTSTGPSQSNTGEWQGKLENAQKSLKDVYLTRFKKVYPFSLPFTFDIENTWVSLALKERNIDSQATEDHAKLLKRAFKQAKMLIIEGNPATGKTSFMRRLAYEWAKEKQEPLYYDLVLYVEFRKVLEKTFESVVDLVIYYLKTILKKESYENLETLMNNEQFCEERRILILLDGYDESSLEKQCSELNTYLFDSVIDKALLFHVVITTRKGYLTDRHGLEGRFVFAEVLGFTTKEQKEKYIYNHFLSSKIDSKYNVAAVHSLLDNNDNLNTLAKTPLFLTFICLVHERLVDGTLVELYCRIIWWLIDRHQKNNPTLNIPVLFGFQSNCSDMFETIQNHYLDFPQLHSLAKMAFRNLHMDIIDYSAIEKFNLQPILEQVGLLRKEKKYDSSFKLASSLFFPHRTIQEFLGAFHYICSSDVPSKRRPDTILDTTDMMEVQKFILRIALSDIKSINAEQRKYYFESIIEISFSTMFDGFYTTSGFNYKLLNWFFSQCKNVKNIKVNGLLHCARHLRNASNDTSKHNKTTAASKIFRPTLFLVSDLMNLHSLEVWLWVFEANSQHSITNCPSLESLQFYMCELESNTNLSIATLAAVYTVKLSSFTLEANSQLSITDCPFLEYLSFNQGTIKGGTNFDIATLAVTEAVTFLGCTFEANSQLSITNCPSMKNLIFSKCEIESSTNLGIAITLPAIDTMEFQECTFKANSQLSITPCPSMNNLKFDRCEIEYNTNFSIATLPAIDTVEFYTCKIDLTQWQSIINAIRNSSVKCLKFEFRKKVLTESIFKKEYEEVFNKELLIHLQKCNNVDKIEITLWDYKVRQNDLLSFSDLIKLHSLEFHRCTFETSSQLSIANCPTLKNLKFKGCRIYSSTNLDIATLPAIDTVEFYLCTIDLATWQSITDQNKNSSIKRLTLTFMEVFNKEFFILLRKWNGVEKMAINILRYRICQNDMLSFSDLTKLHSLSFYECTFEANSERSIMNCPSFKMLKFYQCEFRNSTNLGTATLPAIDAVKFLECNIDLHAWQSITNTIRNSSVKCLKLTFGENFNKEFLIYLQKFDNVEKMEIEIQNYKISQNDLLSFNDLMKLHTLSLRSCTFEANSQLSFINCIFLRNFRINESEMESTTNLGIAILPAIDTVEFYKCTIDFAAWQSITDQISKSSVKCLELSADYFATESYPEFLQHLQKCKCIEQLHVIDVHIINKSYHILERSEEAVTINLAETARILAGLRSITVLNEFGGRLDECRILKERNKERIEKAGQERFPDFLIKYAE